MKKFLNGPWAVSIGAMGFVIILALVLAYLLVDESPQIEDWTQEAHTLCWPRESEDAMNAVRAMKHLPPGFDVAQGLGDMAAYSPEKTKIALAGGYRGFPQEIYLVNSDGSNLRELPVSKEGFTPYYPVWSPDGKYLSVSNFEFGGDYPKGITKIEVTSGHITQMTQPPGDEVDLFPVWSPKGDRIAFLRYRVPTTEERGALEPGELVSDIYLMNADGSNLKRVGVSDKPDTSYQARWSPDGKSLAFSGATDPGSLTSTRSLYLVRADGTGLRKLSTRGRIYTPIWSKDGRSIAYSGKQRGSVDDHFLVDIRTGKETDITSRCLQENYPRPQLRQ